METKPTLLRRYVREWNVYAELHRTRQLGYGVGPQPIQPSEIAAWLDLHCIFSPEMRLWYYDIVRGIDLRYVTYSRNKISSEVENKKQG